jgi:hypothetical protein
MSATSARSTSFADGKLIGPPLELLAPASPLELLEVVEPDEDVVLPEDEAPPSGGCT